MNANIATRVEKEYTQKFLVKTGVLMTLNLIHLVKRSGSCTNTVNAAG